MHTLSPTHWVTYGHHPVCGRIEGWLDRTSSKSERSDLIKQGQGKGEGFGLDWGVTSSNVDRQGRHDRCQHWRCVLVCLCECAHPFHSVYVHVQCCSHILCVHTETHTDETSTPTSTLRPTSETDVTVIFYFFLSNRASTNDYFNYPLIWQLFSQFIIYSIQFEKNCEKLSQFPRAYSGVFELPLLVNPQSKSHRLFIYCHKWASSNASNLTLKG